MIDLLNLKPGVNYLNMSHDYGCPSIDSQCAFDCTCSPELSLVTEKEWLKGVNQTRKQRRKAARAAQKAMKKMRGG